MKINKTAFLCALILVLTVITAPLEASGADKDTVGEMLDGIVVYKSDGQSVQGFIDSTLVSRAGLTSEWYIMALAQSGRYDFSKYEAALLNYLKENRVPSATTREKYALALISIGSSDKYIYEAIDSSIGEQGLMSLVFGLHILNNGYTSDKYTQSQLAEKILSLQLSDGGFAVIGDKGDVDCTAMTVQALAPLYKNSSRVKAACDKAVSFLSEIQRPDGGYVSFGVSNCESLCQVILALCCLGKEPAADESFIKGGNTLIDALEAFRLQEGGFCHSKGEGVSESATTQAFYTLCGLERLYNGKGSFYLFDKAAPQTAQKPTGEKVTSVQTSKQTQIKTQSVTSQKSSASKTTVSTSTGEKDTTTTRTTKKTAADTTGGKVTSSKTGSEKAGTSSADKTSSESTTQVTDSEITTSYDTPAAQGEESSALPSDTEAAAYSSQLSETAETAGSHAEGAASGSKVKVYIYIGAGVLTLAGVIVLLAKGKSNVKSYIFIIAAGAAVCAVTFFLEIKTPEEYYKAPESVQNAETAGTVSISIDCLVLAGEDNELVPSDGYLIHRREYSFKAGETAYDALVSIAKENSVVLDIKGSDDMVYVAGIGGLYEYDFGELSGWMYYVNGKAPSVNSSQYVLQDGDKVEWRYTREIGHDL